MPKTTAGAVRGVEPLRSDGRASGAGSLLSTSTRLCLRDALEPAASSSSFSSMVAAPRAWSLDEALRGPRPLRVDVLDGIIDEIVSLGMLSAVGGVE